MSCSNFKLNLPTDIPWKRICVTEDMIDTRVCDKRLPAKWQTSLAVFKYKPEDEFQMFPDYDITYLKVTATITGYQPLDKEIQGEINWDGVNIATIPGLTDLLNSYNPCHGAILQVVVGPKNKQTPPDLDNYPFFLDFEPKKRELYELATDTLEKQSRSIESLNITKSSGSTQSMEVLDIDMGGSVGFGAQGSYAGTGGGFNFSSSSQGQWGTKNLNSDQSMSSRSADVGQEKRESYSYSTQLSQMYHLLDSYHLGTNRVVFFVQPRPHTLEEPSGFVRGPRPVEGIQEFFMVVAQPKEQKDFCVSLRLDTSHLTKTPIMEYDRKTEVSDMASASAAIATKNDTLGSREKWGEACAIWCWDMYYKCYLTHDEDDTVYTAPDGYVIESYTNLVNSSSHGSSNVSISPNGKTLTIHAEANGKNCFEDTFGCVDCPDEWQRRAGHARRQVEIHLVSEEPIKQVGEDEALMITTRGLCCCPQDKVIVPLDEYVVSIKPVPNDLKPGKYLTDKFVNARSVASKKGTTGNTDDKSCKECSEKDVSRNNRDNAKYTIRQANELGNYIKTETIKSLNDPNVKLEKFAETEFFARQLKLQLVQFKKGRELLNESVTDDLPEKAIGRLEKVFNKSCKEITRQDLLSLRNEELSKLLGMDAELVNKIKLTSLGVVFNKDKGSAKTKKGKAAK